MTEFQNFEKKQKVAIFDKCDYAAQNFVRRFFKHENFLLKICVSEDIYGSLQ